jgi:RNA polymerase sigma-70 factor (ECF subfamily)
MLFRKRGKRDEFEREARAVFPSVFSTALRMARDREEAEDLTQEAIVRAYEAYDRFDGRNFKAWMLRILTNLYINRYRKRERGPEIGSLEDEPTAENVPTHEGDPVSELFDELMSEQVEEALASLPEEYRSAILLCDVEGMSYEEIAQATSVPIGTVRSRIARGRAALRRKLGDYARQEGYLNRKAE